MSTVKSMTFAERAGHTVVRWLKPVARLESTLWRSLVTAGAPRPLVLLLKWVVRFALLLGVLYVSVVPALTAIVLVLLGRVGTESMDDKEFQDSLYIHDYMQREQEALEPLWREGHSGWGLYSRDDHALDVDNLDDYRP